MTTLTEATALCTLEGVRLNYGSGDVLKGIDLTLPSQKIVALLGLNGAGKSTLMQILAGFLQPTAGKLTRRGSVAMVHQELSLLPDLTIAENIALPRMETYGRRGFIRWRHIEKDCLAALNLVGLNDLSPRTLVKGLSTGEQQLVEIARALLLGPTLLILDEPTSALSRPECEKLFLILKKLAAAETTILFVSHRLEEVKELADEIIILRDGVVANHLKDLSDYQNGNKNDLVSLMTGEGAAATAQVETQSGRSDALRQSPVLKLRSFKVKEKCSQRTLVQWPAEWELGPGQCVGLAGLLGSGRSLALQSIAGSLNPAHGGAKILLEGLSTHGACQGEPIAYLHEDRKTAGLFADLSALENIVISENNRSRNQRAHALWPLLKVKGHPRDKANSLSGGNQQKLLLGRALLSGARLLLLDEPTRGVDGHARLEIYKLINEFKNRGGSLLWTSSDYDELWDLSDEILHIHGGVIGTMPPHITSGKGVTDHVLNFGHTT